MKMIDITRQIASSAPLAMNFLIVGGWVRDQLLGLDSKDLDLEVFGDFQISELIDFLSQFGEVNQVGRSFGVIKLRIGKIELDVAVPRRENKVGNGHKGFIVSPDPTMSFVEASARRDFTWNAMGMEPITGELIDPHGGQEDIAKGIIRHVGPAFEEDPLRVLRGMQFAGRFNMTVAPETARLCQSLKSEFYTLAKERIGEEWSKWAKKSHAHQRGLDFLVQTGWHEFFPAVPMKWSPIESKNEVHVFARLLWEVKDPKTAANQLGLTPKVAERVVKLVSVKSRDPLRMAHELAPATIADWAVVTHETKTDLVVAEALAKGVFTKPPTPILQGRDLIKQGLKPGPAFGRILRKAFNAQLNQEFKNLAGALKWLKI